MPDDKINQTVADMVSGNLVNTLKKNGKYITTGILIGAVVGFGIATLTGKCKFCLPFWGALIGGSSGYLLAHKTQTYNSCGCL